MKKSRTSTFYFPVSCLKVYETVTSGKGAAGFTFQPMPGEEYEAARNALKKGQVLARVTHMEEGSSCGYEMDSAKFHLVWRAEFSPVGNGECRMVMTETYYFHSNAVGTYLLALLFLRQKSQHKAFREEILHRLEQRFDGPAEESDE